MRLELAPRAVHEPHVCENCYGDDYVIYEGDKLCPTCGFIEGSGDTATLPDPWTRWRTIRNQQWEDGKHDHRATRKVVGSYVHAYYDDDGNVVL